MARVAVEAHWRDSARSVKFFMWDAKAAFPIAFFLLYMSWWTLGLTIFTMVFFSVLNRYGFTMSVFARWFRNALAGPRKPSCPWWME